jgi:hypothetical protein
MARCAIYSICLALSEGIVFLEELYAMDILTSLATVCVVGMAFSTVQRFMFASVSMTGLAIGIITNRFDKYLIMQPSCIVTGRTPWRIDTCGMIDDAVVIGTDRECSAVDRGVMTIGTIFIRPR